MKRTGRHLLASRRWIMERSRGLLCVALVCAAVVLSACGASSSDTQTGSIAQPSNVPSEARVTSTEVTTQTTAVANVGEASTAVPDRGVAPITAVMEELGVEGERYAAVGDPNAPLTVIEFSDYG